MNTPHNLESEKTKLREEFLEKYVQVGCEEVVFASPKIVLDFLDSSWNLIAQKTAEAVRVEERGGVSRGSDIYDERIFYKVDGFNKAVAEQKVAESEWFGKN